MRTPATKPILLLGALLLAASGAIAATPPTRAFIEVNGLACPFCVQGLEKQLKKLDAVAGVRTSLQKGEAIVDFKSGRSASEDELRAAVQKAGFTAGRIRLETKPGDTPAAGEAEEPDGTPKKET